MSSLGTAVTITSLPGRENRWGKSHARILDQRQDKGTDRSCFTRHDLTSTNYCSCLIQPAIIMDKSVIGKP
ncbi:hypothetical protein D1F64_09025 [Breoghania sp. L-A4]|nr:hypothetical protein D1F64_09025 [Breoghania sp. L-A4]